MLPLPPYLTSAAAAAAFFSSFSENYYSMDQHPSGDGRNVVRPEPRLAASQPQSHSLFQHQHQSILQPQHFHSPYQHQATLSTVSGGTTMGRLVVDNEYLVENPMFRTPRSISLQTSGLPHHAQHSTPDDSVVCLDSPPPPSSYAEQGGKPFGRKRSRKRPKTCGVCGDRAKSFHFGGLSCDSCKAFFRRSVQNDAHTAFRCAYDSCCDINISTRKSCQFCRFKKCLAIGMEKSWVMTEEERNHLNQQRLEKKQNKPLPPPPPQQQPSKSSTSTVPSQSLTQGGGIVSAAASSAPPAPPEPKYTFQSSTVTALGASKEPAAIAIQESEYIADVDKMLDYMTYEDQLEIKSVVETYLHAYKEMPFRVSLEEGRRDTLEIIEMFTTILRRFAYFSRLIPDFAALKRGDQGNLLRAAVLEMCLLRGAACFDTENSRWPNSNMESLKDCPQLRVEDMQRLVSRELFEMHITFIFHMKRLRIDEPIAMLLICTVLFSPERTPVDDRVRINQAQEKYLMLLKKYVSWKFGQTAGSRIYPQLLTKLSDLRQLNDFHTEFHLNLDRKEVNAIKKSLVELHLNPYPNWKIVPESRQSSPEESRAASPVLPSPMAEDRAPSSMPMVTQALIQSFADRRIPTLLDNPYATFETDLGMIRQVQQTLGSLFPGAGLSPAFTSNTQPVQRHTSTDSESTNPPRTFSPHDPLLSLDKSISCGRPSSISPNPRGYCSSTDSAEAEALEILKSSRQQEFQPPPLKSIRRKSIGSGGAVEADGSSTTTTPSSSHLESPLISLLPSEYHSDRLQKFLQHRGSGGVRSTVSVGLETESVIRSLVPSAFPPPSSSISSSALLSGSQPVQTVLRKHSSSGSSLPVKTPSVIRSAPARSTTDISSSSTLRGSHFPSCTSVGGGPSASEGREATASSSQSSFQSISLSGMSSTGWHGGEVHTTTNGHRISGAGSAITVNTRIQHLQPAPPPPNLYEGDSEEGNEFLPCVSNNRS